MKKTTPNKKQPVRENVASIVFYNINGSFGMERLLFVQEIYNYIFEDLNFFFLSIVIVCVSASGTARKPPVYPAEKLQNETFGLFFSTKSATDCDPKQAIY